MKPIFIQITENMMEIANERNAFYKSLYGTNGTRLVSKNEKIRETGYLGEEIVKKAYPFLLNSENPKFDLIFKEATIDVKSVGCNTEPKIDYVGTVFDFPIADILIFTRVLNDRSAGWICGSITTENFFKKCTTISANTKNNNFTYEYPRKIIEYSLLQNLDSIIKGLT